MSQLSVDLLPKEELGENFLKKGHRPTFSPNLFQKLPTYTVTVC